MKKNYLLEDGRLAIRVRKPLRAFVDAKKNRTTYINELIEKDAQAVPLRPHEVSVKTTDYHSPASEYQPPK